MTRNRISHLFRKEVEATFSHDIVFSFLCGSYARSDLNADSDIDIFICVGKRNKTKERKFRSWYFSLHKKTHLKPDRNFTYEITDLAHLKFSLNKIENATPQINIANKSTYEGIVWAGMLSGPCTGFTGDRRLYSEVKRRATKTVESWKRSLLSELRNLPPDQFLKFTIHHEKH